MLGILIGAFILMGALYCVARHDAAIEFPRIVFVSLGILIVSLILSPLGPLALPLLAGATAWILVRFCYVSWGQAWIVTVIYLGAQIGLAFLLRR